MRRPFDKLLKKNISDSTYVGQSRDRDFNQYADKEANEVPPININIAILRQTSEERKRKIYALSQVNSGVSSFRYSVDTQITTRRSIGSRLSKAAHSIESIELRLRKLDGVINQSLDQYEQTERHLVEKAQAIGKFDWSKVMDYMKEHLLEAIRDREEQKYNIEGLDWSQVSPNLRDQLRGSIDLAARQRSMNESNESAAKVPDSTKPVWRYDRERPGVNDVYFTDEMGIKTLINFDKLLIFIEAYKLEVSRSGTGHSININDIINFRNEDIEAFLNYVMKQGYDPRTFNSLDIKDMPSIEKYIKARIDAYETKPTPELIAFGKGFMNGVASSVKAILNVAVEFVVDTEGTTEAIKEGIINVTIDLYHEAEKFTRDPEKYMNETWGSVEKAYEEYNKLSLSEKSEFIGVMLGQGAVSALTGGVVVSGAKKVAVFLKGDSAILDKIAKKFEDFFGKKDSEGTGDIDYKLWEEMPVSGQVKLAPNGQRLISIRELKRFTQDMNVKNIKVVIDEKGKILPDFAAGGFDPKTGQIVLKKEPTYLSAMHESYHAKQWLETGKEEYLKLSTLEREEYVYSQIMKNKDLYTAEEILFSQRYIYKLRTGEWPPPEWKGFE